MMSRDIASGTQPFSAPVTQGRKVVAAVGIDRYRVWPTLDNAVSDARATLGLFQQLGFEPIVTPLLDEAATAEAIRRLVTDDLATLGSDDSLVLFFAGHGHTQTRTLSSGQVQTGFFIPVDGDRTEGHTATWLRLDSLLSDVARLPARHILVILDACHSGIALSPTMKWRGANDVRGGDSLDELRRRQSRRVITSALSDQRAMDGGPIHGHSLFTGCLLEGLTGGLAKDSRVEATGSELGIYIQQRVASYSGSQQTPDFGTLEFDDRGELVVPIATGDRSLAPTPLAPKPTMPIDTGFLNHGSPAFHGSGIMPRRHVQDDWPRVIAGGGTNKNHAAPSSSHMEIENVLRRCPFCAETIRDVAIKCKHCGSDLMTSVSSVQLAARPVSVGPLQAGNPEPNRLVLWLLKLSVWPLWILAPKLTSALLRPFAIWLGVFAVWLGKLLWRRWSGRRASPSRPS
jgi:hypothetical protein